MLTPERLSEVSWALGKMRDGRSALAKLLEGEPDGQPPTDRLVAMRQIENELGRLEDDLEALFS
jgi:hypothetical protein